MYQLFGTSSWVSTRTTPGTSSAALRSTSASSAWWRSERCIFRCSIPVGYVSSKNSRAPGHVPERVGALDGRADDVEVARALLAEVAGIELLGLEGHQRTTAVRRAAASRTALMIDS